MNVIIPEDENLTARRLEGQLLKFDPTIRVLGRLLDPRQFFRISRQFLVSLGTIRTIHTYSAVSSSWSSCPRRATRYS